MRHTRGLVVGLLSHHLRNANLGCVALSIGDIILIDQAAGAADLQIEYRLLVNEKHPHVGLDFTSNPYRYATYSSSRQTLRHPLQWLFSDIYADCDLVININAGDGFTDLYGFGRVLSESYMSKLAQLKHVPVIMAPQTVGPFRGRLSRMIARNVLSHCHTVFTRDGLSTDLCGELGVGSRTRQVMDVAFALPYTPIEHQHPGPNVGVNVSGLLYRGGYDRKNYFDLAIDYREFTHQVIRRLLDAGSTVHLIPHVLSSRSDIEDDYSACDDVHRSFPATILPGRFGGPIEAKSYIAGLDFFTGARMHATIAAISSNVPVVPIGYSRKMPGLYDALGYGYYIDARDSRWEVPLAVAQVLEWFADRDELRQAIESAHETVESSLFSYRDSLVDLFGQIVEAR